MLRSRLRGLLLTGLFLAGTVSQVGCGVFHCVTPEIDVAAEAPQLSCHEHASGKTDEPNVPSGEHDGKGACCVTFVAERDSAPAASVSSLETTLVAVEVQAEPADPSLAHPDFRETGQRPPWMTGAAVLPLRI